MRTVIAIQKLFRTNYRQKFQTAVFNILHSIQFIVLVKSYAVTIVFYTIMSMKFYLWMSELV